MRRPTLAKGTVVKHGTVASSLLAILSEGLRAGATRDELRDKIEEKPVSGGVYVATLGAYIGAYRAFAANNMRLSLSDSGVPTIPIVLNIELEEDCEYIADEDFVPLRGDGAIEPGDLVSLAEGVWEQYGSAVISRSIPVSWIRSFEFPYLADKEGIERGGKIGLKFWADVDLFVLSKSIPRMKNPLEVWQEFIEAELRSKTGVDFSRLSNIEKFTKGGVSRFLELSTIRNRDRLKQYARILDVAVSREMVERGLQNPADQAGVVRKLLES